MQDNRERQPHAPLDLFLSPVKGENQAERSVEAKQDHQRLRAGDICPKCKQEKLDYDGLLNLICPKCGIASSGCFT